MSKYTKTESGEMSDEDSISITSTAPSEPREEYAVEAIIAEREVDGTMEYLVRWEGYPDERCTWEPESSFQSEVTLFEWKTQKMRVSRGLATQCDVEALLDRVEKWITASENRKARRRTKRMRLGMSVTPMETEVDDESHNDRRQPKSGKDVPAGHSQALLNKGTSSKKDSIPPRSRRSSEQTDGRPNPLKEKPQVSTGQDENTGMSVVRNAPTAVMFHPQRQEDQGSNRPTSTTQTSLGSPIKSPAGAFRKPTDAVKKLQTIRDSPPELYPQGQEVQMSNNPRSTAKNSPVSPIKSSLGTSRKSFDFSRRLSTTRDSLPEKESGISNPTTNVPSLVPPKLTSNRSGRGSGTYSRSGMAGPTSPTKEAHPTRQVQMGSSGRGPARLRTSNLMHSPTSPKRPSVSGPALLKNWNKDVKPRKSMTYQGALPKANERASEKFNKLSIKRKYEKAGRNEPAPDMNQLVLINPKPAAEKPFLSLPGLKIPSKTPFEMIQEGLNESKANESVLAGTPVSNALEAIGEQPTVNANKSDDQKAMSTETSSPNGAYSPSQAETAAEPSENVPLHSTQNPKKKPSLPFQAYRQQTASSLSAVPGNDVKPSSGLLSTEIASPEKSSEHVEMPALQQHSHDPEPLPVNPVTASVSIDHEAENPSIQSTKDSGAKSSQSSLSIIPLVSRNEPNLSIQTPVSDLHKSPSIENDPSSTISISHAPPQSMNAPNSLRPSMGSATSPNDTRTIKAKAQFCSFDLTDEENDFISSTSMGDVIGTLMIGPECQNLGEVRFRVPDLKSKKLLLKIKVFPRQMHFWFQQICTAEDYRAYYHTVSTACTLSRKGRLVDQILAPL